MDEAGEVLIREYACPEQEELMINVPHLFVMRM